MSRQAHGSAPWRELAGSGAVPSVAPGKLVNVPPRMGFEWNWGDPLPYGLAFTGDANRTYIDANGVVRTAPYNLIASSEQFDTWGLSNAGTGAVPVVTANAGVGPDGKMTADKVVFAAPVSGDQSVISAPTVPTTTGAKYTGSTWVLASSTADVGKVLLFRHAGGGSYTAVTLSSSWQRVSSTEVAFGATSDFEIGLRPAIGGSAGTVSVLLYGAQIQPGPNLEAYVKTTGAAAGGPRSYGYVFDKNATLQPAWLIEAARTNRCPQSQNIAGAWGLNGTGATLTGGFADPFGTTVATQVAQGGGGSSAGAQMPITFAADGEKCVSVYVKQGTSSLSWLTLYDGAAGHRHLIQITWNSGVPTLSTIAGSGTRYTPQPHTGGWWRIAWSAVGCVAANPNYLILYASDTSLGATTFYVGAQVEDAQFPSSYIPTTSAAVTRATEIASLPWGYAPQATTMYAKFVERGGANTASSGIVAIGDPTNFLLLWAPSGSYQADYDFFQTTSLAAPVLGDTVELRAVLTAAGGISAGQSLNGAAETTTSTVAGSALPVAWHSPRLSLCGPAGLANPSFAAFQSIRLALGGPWSLDQMRKLAVDPNRSTFSTTGAPSGSLVTSTRGYAITPGNLAGTGKIAFVRNGAKGVIY